eukprot:TRINITY_DN614_c0_g1_i1.p1 TRINITY_DN614_c0_g1~~TRINITY_DN614_c0_g1_i1.p1  ORF type:complete len:146 (-),score=15.05 TRINITY_DN614_c0_g1_i1:73-510(-)
MFKMYFHDSCTTHSKKRLIHCCCCYFYCCCYYYNSFILVGVNVCHVNFNISLLIVRNVVFILFCFFFRTLMNAESPSAMVRGILEAIPADVQELRNSGDAKAFDDLVIFVSRVCTLCGLDGGNICRELASDLLNSEGICKLMVDC